MKEARHPRSLLLASCGTTSEAMAYEGSENTSCPSCLKMLRHRFASERAIPQELHTVASVVSVVVFVFLSPFLLQIMFCPQSTSVSLETSGLVQGVLSGLRNTAPGSIASSAY